MNAAVHRPLRFLAVALGTLGDLHPFLGVGAALVGKGHRVEVISNPLFKEAIERAGLEFVGIGSEREFLALLEDPLMWKPRHGARVLAEGLILPYIDPVFREIERRAGSPDLVVLAPVTAFGARIAAEALGVRLATIALQPVLFRSVYDSPGLPFVPHSRGFAARWMRRGLYRFIDQFLFDAALKQPVNRYRAQFGLPPEKLLIQQWIFSPDLIVGLFPDWFGAPQSDWPTHAVTTGFPLFDESSQREPNPTLTRFLDDGDAPVLLTPGTGNRHAGRFFKAGLEACRRLGRRALLLTHFPEQIPLALTSRELCLPYAPFSRVLPRAASVVHHGGIGTSAQCLSAGLPQLVVPSSYDQPDNAGRLARLGVAQIVWPWQLNARDFEQRLSGLVESSVVKERCRVLSTKLSAGDSVTEICAVLEAFALRSS